MISTASVDQRSRLTRSFFGTAAAASVALALALWLQGALSPGLRAALAGALLLVGAACVAAIQARSKADRYLRASREREARFAGLLGIAADAYWEMDAAYRLTLVSNRRDTDRFVPDETLPRLPPWEQSPFEMDPETLDALRADLESRRPFRSVPVCWYDRRGQRHHLMVSGEPRFDARGVFTGYWGVTRNVTDDVRARQALMATEARHRELFARIPSPLVLHRGGVVIDANPAAVRLFGHANLQAMRGTSLLACYEAGGHREAEVARFAQLQALPLGQGLPVAESRLRALDGRRMVVRGTAVRVEADDGPATLSIYLDDTERKAAEDAVRRSEALLSHLVAVSPDVITLIDVATGRYAMVNDTFTRLTGYRHDEVIGRTSAEIGIWGQDDTHERIVRLLRSHGVVRDVPCQLVTKAGKRRSMLASASRFVMDGRDYLVVNARDVTEYERARLEREAILDNASIGIALTRDQTFVMANPALEDMFGWPRGTLVGQQGRVCWPDEAAYVETLRAIAPALGRGEQVDVEITAARRDGSTFLCRMLARAVDPTHPSRGGTIWIAEDVTGRRQVEQALAKARDDAEAASRAKSAFLANTSHEIRTPLNGLVGLARLARQPGIDEARRRQYLEQIFESADTLASIISDILDLSKIEAGKLHVENVPFGLRALLATLHRGYKSIADARALTLELHIDPAVPPTVLGDPMRVRQIVSNYVSNALKFTPRGGVRIEVHAAAGGGVRIEVHDTGPGIDGDTRARLFRPFMQADQSTTRRFGGTGLGLSICHELARLMGGSVGVDSAPGAGSCFWAELPLPATDESESNSGFGALEGSTLLTGARILMVEDNAVNMMISTALLEQWGAQVVQASNGRQAVEAVERAHAEGRRFDAVLMDVQMPVMSGHEAARVLRQRYPANALPIIALTAAALTSERESALAAGMNDFLTKPVDAQRLHATLARLLARTARA